MYMFVVIVLCCLCGAYGSMYSAKIFDLRCFVSLDVGFGNFPKFACFRGTGLLSDLGSKPLPNSQPYRGRYLENSRKDHTIGSGRNKALENIENPHKS